MSFKKVFRGDFFAVDTDAYTFIDGEKRSIFEKSREIKASLGIEQATHDLLCGGKVVVNPAFQGRWLRDIEANCYDVISMYPRVHARNAGHNRPPRGESES